MIKQVCRGWVTAKSRTRVSEINSSSYYCKSPLSETTWPMWSRLCKGQGELQRQKEVTFYLFLFRESTLGKKQEAEMLKKKTRYCCHQNQEMKVLHRERTTQFSSLNVFPQKSLVLGLSPYFVVWLSSCVTTLSPRFFTLKGDFPGGPVAKTPCSQCRGPRFHLWSWK